MICWNIGISAPLSICKSIFNISNKIVFKTYTITKFVVVFIKIQIVCFVKRFAAVSKHHLALMDFKSIDWRLSVEVSISDKVDEIFFTWNRMIIIHMGIKRIPSEIKPIWEWSFSHRNWPRDNNVPNLKKDHILNRIFNTKDKVW